MSDLDRVASSYGIYRIVGESDDALRYRLMFQYPAKTKSELFPGTHPAFQLVVNTDYPELSYVVEEELPF